MNNTYVKMVYRSFQLKIDTIYMFIILFSSFMADCEISSGWKNSLFRKYFLVEQLKTFILKVIHHLVVFGMF